MRSFLSHRVDAIVFAGGGFADEGYRRELDALLTPFRDRNAVVRLSPHEDGEPFLSPDNHGGAEAMTRHLLELGHRTIGFIEGPPAFPPSIERVEGYRSALRGRSSPRTPRWLSPGTSPRTAAPARPPRCCGAGPT